MTLILSSYLYDSSMDSARNAVVFRVRRHGNVRALLSKLLCQGIIDEGKSLCNLFGLVSRYHGSAAGALNRTAAALATFRSTTALTLKRQPDYSSIILQQQMNMWVYISILAPVWFACFSSRAFSTLWVGFQFQDGCNVCFRIYLRADFSGARCEKSCHSRSVAR